MRYTEIILEAQEIDLAIKAAKSLSYEAEEAIYAWESMNWHTGPLEQAFKTNSPLAAEIETAFEPVRVYLRQKYGDTINLYRGMVKKYNGKIYPDRVLSSWTSDKKVAEHFAGLRTTRWKSLLYPEYTDAQVEDAIKTYNSTGFVSFAGKKYVRDKNDPQYFSMYDRRNEYITGSDNIEYWLRSDNAERRESNQAKLDNAILLNEDIPVDRIVWLTNSLNSKEFIVRA
jgi:hypothetical protein